VDILSTFAELQHRVIRCDFTFRYRNVHYQIEAAEADSRMPTTKVTLEHRLDGTTWYRWGEAYLLPTPLAKAPEPARPEPKPPVAPSVRPVPADHPWRKNPLRVGRARFTPIVAYAAAPLRPDTPSPEMVVSLSP
jgi:hypothetical protein